MAKEMPSGRIVELEIIKNQWENNNGINKQKILIVDDDEAIA